MNTVVSLNFGKAKFETTFGKWKLNLREANLP
jgi:hypothetical protein